MAFRKMYNILCGDQTLYRTYLHNGITRHIKNPLNVTLLHRPIKKIMSWNIQELFWYSNSKKLNNVIDYLKRSDCDVVCLQETNVEWENILKNGLSNKYPFIQFKHRGIAGGYATLSKYPIIKSNKIKNKAGWFPAWAITIKKDQDSIQILNTHLKFKTILSSH